MKYPTLCLVLVFLNILRTGAATCDPLPNIVILFADDLGYGDLGCYGHPAIRTPHLDRLADEGLRLTSYYAGSCVCSPSRASLLTGKYPVHCGVTGVFNHNSVSGLPLSETTLADRLREAGYATFMIGKWHLGHQLEYLPLNRGFDYWYGVPYSNDDNGITVPGNDYLDGPPLPLYENNCVLETGISMDEITQLYTEKAIRCIQSANEQPFFLYLAYTQPHVPLGASARFRGRSGAGLYGDAVGEIDWSVGEILSALRSMGLDEHTLVVFTSDNGPMIHMEIPGYSPDHVKPWDHGSSGPLRGGKFDLYEGGFRVPAILRWPGRIAAATVSSGIVSATDLYPTLLHLAGLSAGQKDQPDGVDQAPFLLHGEPSQRNAVRVSYGAKLKAYREGRWKILEFSDSEGDPRYELYDLENDISERYDLSASGADVLEHMKEILKRE